MRAPDASPAPPVLAPAAPARKVFNCIVDDTALIAGVKKSTRDGIRKWVAQGAITLFVPLHTLAALHRLKNGPDRIHADARDAVKWLDDITSDSPSTSRVVLEGVDEAYTNWADVARLMLPDTLLSLDDSDSLDDDDDDDDDDEDDDDNYHEDLGSSFNALDLSDATSLSSASLDPQSPQRPDKTQPATIQSAPDSACATTPPQPTSTSTSTSTSPRAVPAHLQPLFNHVLWRIHNEANPDHALASYILLTNDPAKQAIASKFGIRAKRLEQLRDTVAREDREYKNHLTLHRIESDSTMAKPAFAAKPATTRPATTKPVTPKSNHDKEDASDDDVVLFQRAPRGPAATTATTNQRVWDPNDFGRASQQSPRGRGAHMAPRARGISSPRGRGAFVPRGAYVPPGPPVRAPRAAPAPAPVPAPRHDPNAPIDPNSFARPVPRASPARGGSGRKLWEPN